MPVAAIFALALLAQDKPKQDQPKPWAYYRFGETGLRLFLPEPPVQDPADKTQFTLSYQGLDLKVTATKADTAKPLPRTERYLAAIGKYQKEYGKKIVGTLNEATVVAALRFGAESSIGFVLEVDGGPGATIGWHLVRCDGYDYEILITGEKKHEPWVLSMLDSQQYVDLKTGKFKTAPIGALGIQSILGSAFIALDGTEPDKATNLVLQGDNVPVVGAAQTWTPDAVDYSNAESVQKAFTKQIIDSNVAQLPQLSVKETTKDGQKVYVVNGFVTVFSKKINVEGRAFVFPDHASSVILIFDPEDKDSAGTAAQILDSLQKTPAPVSH